MENNTKIQKEKCLSHLDMKNNLQDEKMENQKTDSQKKESEIRSSNTIFKEETIVELKNQLEILMNSLAVLSAEKSRMEANFQTEKKQIRSEREEYERVIKNLKEKLKRIQGHSTSEVEHLKYKLIMERHDREKEQIEYSTKTKELQRMINNEQKSRELLELQSKELKNSTTKSQNKILEAELDILKTKLKQAETTANETPTMLLNLQSEMSIMRKKYRNAIIEEQKRASIAEQEAKTLAAHHESRVAGLEARLAELSDIVGGYDRLRQQDQKAIQKLKDELNNLQNNKKLCNHETPQQLVDKIKTLYFQLVELDKNPCTNIKDLLNSLKLCDKSQEFIYKEKYENLLYEFEEFKKNTLVNNKFLQNSENNNNEMQLHRAKSHNKNLEEKLRMLLIEMAEQEKDFKLKLEKERQLLQDQYLKTEQLLSQKESEYLNKIAILEEQLLRQRERSLTVIQEKDKEIQTLKSSFEALLPKKGIIFDSNNHKSNMLSRHGNLKGEASDLVSGLLTIENNPPMLHYNQELARKEVQISSLRKENVQLETAIRELGRNSFRITEKHEGEIKALQTQIVRLEASKSRENANLEYLKNVFINYLTSNDAARKHHMLNAISTILRFTTEECEKISKYKQ